MGVKIQCPICGRRNGYEFTFGGEDKGPRPEENSSNAKSSSDYIHNSSNICGIQKEWWFHSLGCGLWFTIKRDTVNNIQIKE